MSTQQDTPDDFIVSAKNVSMIADIGSEDGVEYIYLEDEEGEVYGHMNKTTAESLIDSLKDVVGTIFMPHVLQDGFEWMTGVAGVRVTSGPDLSVRVTIPDHVPLNDEVARMVREAMEKHANAVRAWKETLG